MKRKYIFISIYILFILILVELTLLSAGKCLIWRRRKKENLQNKYIEIVCVGDSHTFGVGTAKQYSYPAQLEKLLNYNNPSQKFSVTNLGIPGANIRRQTEELTSFLKNNNPQIVILLTGRNNTLKEIDEWDRLFLHQKSNYDLGRLKTIRFLADVVNHIAGRDKFDTVDKKIIPKKYNDFLDFYLEKIKDLCNNEGNKLIFLSYYNSSDAIIKKFADRYAMPYFDLTYDFEMLFISDEKSKYISLDMSHMNYYGYRFFAERIYKYLFLNQTILDLSISPLTKTIEDKFFYTDKEDVKTIIKLQKLRIMKNKDNNEYPFEFVHLGHIYMEIGKEEPARKCYWMGLIHSNYADNNTIVLPLISLYLNKKQKEKALKICEKILLCNPQNSIAKYYKNLVMQIRD